MSDSSQLNRRALMDAPTSIRMRLARPADAAYLFKLRVDTTLNEHLSAAPPSIDAQSSYLTQYLERERKGVEFYFVIENRATGNDCGAVRIYDLQPRSFSWGSWILDAGKPRLAALESALFVYDFGFGHLDYGASHFEVRHSNDRVIAFHERLGARRLREDNEQVFMSLSRKDLRSRLPALLALTSYAPVFLDGGSIASLSQPEGGAE